MTSYELDRALRQLRMSGMADRSVTDTTSPSGEPRTTFRLEVQCSRPRAHPRPG